MDKLIEYIDRILEWYVELLLWLPLKIWELLLDGLASVIEAIPVPAFFENLGNYAAALDPAIGYFVQPLQIEAGLGIVILAYIIRFVIRRIPLIG